MKIYISGKITGLERDAALRLFESAEGYIRMIGHEPVNPMRDEKPGLSWAEYIAEDVIVIDKCDAMYMLHNWQESNGARVEHHLCDVLGKPIYYNLNDIPKPVCVCSHTGDYHRIDDIPFGQKCEVEGCDCKEFRRLSLTYPTHTAKATSTVNHPSHYNAHPSGIECIEVVRHMGFNIGNAVKYLWRADEKGRPIEDLEKAAWYITDEIERRRKAETN